jgi:hypothetical protein
MHRRGILALVVLMTAACSPSVDQATSTSTSPTVAATTTSQPSADADACAAGDLPFVADGLVAAIGDATGDATSISQVRWEPAATCERLVVSFATDSGAPATSLGPAGVTAYSFASLVRVTLPAQVVDTAVADTLTDGELLERIYVVRDEAGALTIDVHGVDGVPIAARAFVTASPAALVIDIVRDADGTPSSGTAMSDTAVVVTPSSGPGLYPFIVSGYVQPGLRSVRLQLSHGDATTLDRTISLDGSTDAWQGFESRVEDGPGGTSVLFVGQVDANARPVDGVSVSLDLP